MGGEPLRLAAGDHRLGQCHHAERALDGSWRRRPLSLASVAGGSRLGTVVCGGRARDAGRAHLPVGRSRACRDARLVRVGEEMGRVPPTPALDRRWRGGDPDRGLGPHDDAVGPALGAWPLHRPLHRAVNRPLAGGVGLLRPTSPGVVCHRARDRARGGRARAGAGGPGLKKRGCVPVALDRPRLCLVHGDQPQDERGDLARRYPIHDAPGAADCSSGRGRGRERPPAGGRSARGEGRMAPADAVGGGARPPCLAGGRGERAPGRRFS